MNKPRTTNSSWPIFKKITFLFIFIYTVLYTVSMQSLINLIFDPIWKFVVPRFAKSIGHETAITVFTNGSGDTTYNYYQVLLFLILSLFLAFFIAIIEKNKLNYNKLFDVLTLILRYYLAMQMIGYGLTKIFYLQFQFPPPARFDQKLGEFSPMGLLWTFMGFSKGYTIFGGIAEFIGGILLLNRKTTLLGALATFGIMLNVMLLNYCFDVPVKLLSTHMVLMSLFLVGCYVPSFYALYILNKSTPPYQLTDVFYGKTKWQKRRNVVKWLILGLYLTSSIYHINKLSKNTIRNTPNTTSASIYGAYKVIKHQIFSKDGNFSIKPVDEYWQEVTVNKVNIANLKKVFGESLNINLSIDTTSKTIEYKYLHDSTYQTLNYEHISEHQIRVSGNTPTDSIEMLWEKDNRPHLLTSRKFQWINEYPFNK